jgi:hypothetical protein
MGAARDLFRQVGWAVHGKQDAYETLCQAAELWRAEGQPFSAGMAMLRAVDAAWGRQCACRAEPPAQDEINKQITKRTVPKRRSRTQSSEPPSLPDQGERETDPVC